MTAPKRSIRLNRRLLTTSTFDSGALIDANPLAIAFEGEAGGDAVAVPGVDKFSVRGRCEA